LQALAHGAGEPVLAVLDARRGEVFAQPFAATGTPDGPPVAVAPGALEPGGRRVVAVRGTPGGGDALVRGEALLALTAAGRPVPRAELRPVYVREPDAKERPRP
ncbi:MAG TPA: tRNA (adenosine(37)-N6)-threonylcarbamoyltransferase complex dimerization subunit type 1 TsaB, partial [Candidatus Thermoplasmatota archaeon]|nr:tRNA (adenosine(37)-N6)-threonylcarbamoyltransferase complex dimerization subunit type 1 TsaB [Candidatus Thermoplasmatota archaeon]